MYELLIKPLWAVVLSFFMVLVYHLTKWHFFFSLIPWCKVCLLCCLFHCKLLISLPHFGRSRILFYTTYTESVELCSWGIVNQYRLFFINCYGLVRVFNWVFFFSNLGAGQSRNNMRELQNSLNLGHLDYMFGFSEWEKLTHA